MQEINIVQTLDKNTLQEDRFTRIKFLFGDDFSKIAKSSVIIFGVGGVGGFALDCLYRSGVGEIVIVDKDRFDITNQNRQIGAENVGEVKVRTLERLYAGVRGIEAELDLEFLEMLSGCKWSEQEWKKLDENAYKSRLDSANLDSINLDSANLNSSGENVLDSSKNAAIKAFNRFDYVIDAIDDIPAKALLAKSCAHLPYGKFICSTGSAKKLNPLEIRVNSIWKSYGDKFAKKLRNELKKSSFSGDYKAIFSPEPPKCKGLGSFSAVTASFGLQIASEVIRDIIS